MKNKTKQLIKKLKEILIKKNIDISKLTDEDILNYTIEISIKRLSK